MEGAAAVKSRAYKFAKFLVAVLVLWLPLSVLTIIAIPACLWAMIEGEGEYAKNILRQLDHTAATLFGWSGEYTVSAECGASDCKACNVVCWLLDFLDPGHCKGAAKKEGLSA